MKKHVLIALLALLSTSYYSQNEELTCFIDRNDFTNIYVVNGQYTNFLSKNDKNRRIIDDSEVIYQYAYGKGKERDVNGICERRKKYLISSNQDTLLYTLYGGSRIQLNDSTRVERIRTDYGWQYLQNDSTVLCELDFMWNESSWSYNIIFFNTTQETENLNKAVMLSLVKLAGERSKCDCTETEDDSFYFILWAASLAASANCN